MYADDSTYSTSSSNINDIQSRLKNGKDIVDRWSQNSNTELNTSRSNGKKEKLKSSDSFVIILNRTHIENVRYQISLYFISDDSIK